MLLIIIKNGATVNPAPGAAATVLSVPAFNSAFVQLTVATCTAPVCNAVTSAARTLISVLIRSISAVISSICVCKPVQQSEDTAP